jgi:hypothetical protein
MARRMRHAQRFARCCGARRSDAGEVFPSGGKDLASLRKLRKNDSISASPSNPPFG